MRRTIVALALAGGLVPFAACSADSEKAGPATCAEPTEAVQKLITAAARSGFDMGDSTVTDLTPVRYVQVPLGKDQQKFGVVALVGVRADYHLDDPASEAMSVFRGTEVLGVDSAGKVVIPMRDSAAEAFAVTAPRSAGFGDWARGVAATKEWDQVLTCAAG